MRGHSRSRVLATTIIGLLACAADDTASAGDTGFVPRYPGSQVMLYISRPLGVHGPHLNTFGIRYERASPGSSDPAARFCAPLRHRSLIDLQLVRGAAPRMLFGPRVTWDMGRRQLGPTSLAAVAWSPMAAPTANAELAATLP